MATRSTTRALEGQLSFPVSSPTPDTTTVITDDAVDAIIAQGYRAGWQHANAHYRMLVRGLSEHDLDEEGQ